MAKKKIAVLTSGGDAPGMNAAIRGVVRSGISFGYDVIGIERGYAGLLQEKFIKMNLRSVSGILNRGGTILHSSRCDEMMHEDGPAKAAEICRQKGFDGLVCIGGDGTCRGALAISKHGVRCIGIPASIDNDLGCSEYTIGFDTAINTAVELADKIRDTTASHDRCSVVEVMGRKCGDIAISTAIAIGAFAVLVPEIEFDFEKDVIEPMQKARENGKTHFVIVSAEGVGDANEIAARIQKETGFETRATILGHVQRGGIPSEKDRVVGGIMGFFAVKSIQSGLGSRIICVRNGSFDHIDMIEGLQMPKVFNRDSYLVSHMLSV